MPLLANFFGVEQERTDIDMGTIATFFMIGVLMMFGGALGAFYGIFKANNKFLGFILSVFAVIIALVGFEIVKLLMDMNVFAPNINIF